MVPSPHYRKACSPGSGREKKAAWARLGNANRPDETPTKLTRHDAGQGQATVPMARPASGLSWSTSATLHITLPTCSPGTRCTPKSTRLASRVAVRDGGRSHTERDEKKRGRAHAHVWGKRAFYPNLGPFTRLWLPGPARPVGVATQPGFSAHVEALGVPARLGCWASG